MTTCRCSFLWLRIYFLTHFQEITFNKLNIWFACRAINSFFRSESYKNLTIINYFRNTYKFVDIKVNYSKNSIKKLGIFIKKTLRTNYLKPGEISEWQGIISSSQDFNLLLGKSTTSLYLPKMLYIQRCIQNHVTHLRWSVFQK